ncbi:MAG: branched-chain amino acid ABC transporter permease, partial [Alphaproteobacteria bacterium]|nr:branched-chain amino acid ABC transporter permease [Alphaproteobacteria bacterium]
MWDDLQLLLIWAPVVNIQLILEGVFIGAIFALSAYGLALVWGVMNIKNLAQGDFVILGGYLAFGMNMYNIPLLIIMPIIMIIMFVYGWVIYLLM